MRRILLLLALSTTLLPVMGAKPEKKITTLTGKVVPLADVLKKSGAKLDPDAVPFWLALQTDDHKLYPLVKDTGSRMFFADKALLNRPMRISGLVLPGSTILRVTAINSLHQGKPFEVYYWCDVCSIKRGEKMICECCGGPMDLKEEPAK